jgi:hypothetical protein
LSSGRLSEKVYERELLRPQTEFKLLWRECGGRLNQGFGRPPPTTSPPYVRCKGTSAGRLGEASDVEVEGDRPDEVDG